MANSNTVPISGGSGVTRTIRTEQKTSSTASASGASFFTVPDGVVWELRAVHATNPETGSLNLEFVITDSDGTTHASLSNGTNGINAIATGGVAAWDGSILVPETFRIYARWTGGASESETLAWRLYAYETDIDSNPDN